MQAMRLDLAPMTADEFLPWAVRQEEKYELVRGVPVRMMTGAARNHNLVKTNCTIAIGTRLRGSGCQTSSSDMAVRTGPNQVRYPDLVVDCAKGGPDDLATAEPVLIIEVASPSTEEFDALDKLAEYKSVASIQYVLLIQPRIVSVALHAREAEGWSLTRFTRPDDVITLPALGIELPLAEVYAELSPIILPDFRQPSEGQGQDE
jgi:Uma2 family endonuclease